MISPKKIIYSKQGKLFSIWRCLRLIVIIFLLLVIIEKLLKLLNIQYPKEITQSIIIASVLLVTVVFDKEKIESLGIELKIKSFIFLIIGIIWGYFYCVQIEIISCFTSNASFQFVNPFSKDAILLIGYYLFIISLPEELLYRGYLISNVKRDTNYVVAILISFVIFSAVHFISGVWTNVPNLAFGLIFTLLCGLTFILTKNIFIAIGFHGAYDAYNDLFHSDRIGITITLIVLLINIFIFYLIYKKTVNFHPEFSITRTNTDQQNYS